MTEATAKAKRGRPPGSKTKSLASETPFVESGLSPDEREVMQAVADEQIKAQLAHLMKMVVERGIDIKDLVPTPPKERTKEIYATPSLTEEGDVQPIPGMEIPGLQNKIKTWRRFKPNTEDKVSFIPEPVPALMTFLKDEDDHSRLFIDANDCACWLTVGTVNTVSRFFYNVYNESLQEWRGVEKLKREGPKGMPWGERTHQGEKTWIFKSGVPSFGLDDEGHFLGDNSTNPFFGGVPAGVSAE